MDFFIRSTQAAALLAAISVAYLPTASAVQPLNNVAQVTAGSTHACALQTDSTIDCWGDNSSGQLGNGTRNSRMIAAAVYVNEAGAKMDAVTQVVAANGFTCALRSDGVVLCWGRNNVGELGTGDMGVDHYLPTQVALTDPAKSIAAKGEFACAVLDTPQRNLKCWGYNYDGQLGDGTKTNRDSPTDVVITERDGTQHAVTDVVQVAAGAEHMCYVLADTSVACVGSNWLGQLGNGTFSDNASPTAVMILDDSHPKLTDIADVAVNGFQSCARFATTWLVTCWGDNSEGQLGHPGVAYDTASPVAVALGTRSIAAGFENTCAMLADYRVACWGGNTYGQLGTGTTTGSRVPIILSIPNIASLSTGDFFSCAIMADVTVKCWGQGTSGQLGNGYNTNSSNPVAVVKVDDD